MPIAGSCSSVDQSHVAANTYELSQAAGTKKNGLLAGAKARGSDGTRRPHNFVQAGPDLVDELSDVVSSFP